MTEVTIHHEKPLSIMAIVAELRESGYRLNVDFNYWYHPAEHTGGTLVPRYTVFSFTNDAAATWFTLRYIDGSIS